MKHTIGQARGVWSSNRGLHGFHILNRRYAERKHDFDKGSVNAGLFIVKDTYDMDKIKSCAVAFQALLNIRYRCIVGRKGKTIEFTLAFNAHHFHHLAGLHKLSDKQEVRGNRERVYKKILSDDITYSSLSDSIDFPQVKTRLDYLSSLELFMDSNSVVFRYDSRRNALSDISASFLLENEVHGSIIYLFIDKDEYSNTFCGKSFSQEIG